jgi:hypothetical protein
MSVSVQPVIPPTACMTRTSHILCSEANSRVAWPKMDHIAAVLSLLRPMHRLQCGRCVVPKSQRSRAMEVDLLGLTSILPMTQLFALEH